MSSVKLGPLFHSVSADLFIFAVIMVSLVLNRCMLLAQVSEDEHLRCRARAMECVGLVAKAVGKEDMQPFMPNFMQAAFQVET